MALPPPTPEREDDGTMARFTVFDDDDEEEVRQPVFEDTEHLETFVEYLSKRPVLTPSYGEVTQPRQLISALLGNVADDFVEGIGSLRASSRHINERTDWTEVMIMACQVASASPQHFFNKLLTPDESTHAPCSIHFKNELEYLKQAHDSADVRKYNVIGELLQQTGACSNRIRMEWTAALIKLVHLCIAVFKPGMRKAVGTKGALVKRREAAIEASPRSNDYILSYAQPYRAVRDFVSGKIYDVDIFIYELFVHLAMPNIHMSKLTPTTNLFCLAEYHAVRCAVDASSSSVLYICMMSPAYLTDVWLLYMRLYYPRMFVEDERRETEQTLAYRQASVLPQWTHLELYTPSKHQCVPCNPKEMVSFVQLLFNQVLAPEFRASFKSVTVPPEYTRLVTAPGEIFTIIPDDTIAHRRSKRVKSPKPGAFSLKRARTE